jgi:hypothetical protein
MVQGKAIPEPVQWIVVRLSALMPVEDVCMITDISKRSVERIMAQFRKTGDIMVPASRAKHHIHRALCDYDVEVRGDTFLILSLINHKSQHLLTTITKAPDLYLDELRLDLEAKCGVSVSINTVWRTLQKGGFTMKKVCARHLSPGH